jgi:ADP-ribosylglycohydrolase
MNIPRAVGEAYRSRVRGCLQGGAVGDALGAPVEFLSLEAIRRQCGQAGVREYQLARFGETEGYGLVTDDTQMTLFTLEGLIWARMRTDRGTIFTVALVQAALDEWLDTQTLPGPPEATRGVLAKQPWLYARRAPGTTCLKALQERRRINAQPGQIKRFGLQTENDSKGCGGVMRSAPIGLLASPFARIRDRGGFALAGSIFDMAAEAAGYTHGHPTGKLASGALAAIIALLVAGHDLPDAIWGTLDILARHDGHRETSAALQAAVDAVEGKPSGSETVASLGGGWVAEEALAIAVYAALAYPQPERFLDALSLAVTHSGDSDSTGAICGNILGAWHGETALPAKLAFEIEGRGTILELADDFVWEFTVGSELHSDYDYPPSRWSQRFG